MALLPLALAAVAWLGSAAVLRAGEVAPHGVEIRFVPAVANGTVSLAIFDPPGSLVRVVADEWTFNRFRIGLNGLSTTWDGLDGAGRPVPAGVYALRGYVVGDVEVSGEAIHFNDWVEGPESPRIVTVAAAQLLPEGDVLLLARLAGAAGALVRYSPESAARWKMVVSEPRPQPASAAHLAVADELAFVLLDGQLRAVRLEDGHEVDLPFEVAGWRAVAARGQRLALLGEEGISFFTLPDFAAEGGVVPVPVDLVSLGLLEEGAVAAGQDGSLWQWRTGDGWTEWPRPAGATVRGVSGGRGDTWWALEEQADGRRLIVQYSAEEGSLIEWAPPEGGEVPVMVAGAAERDYFVAILSGPSGQRTVAIRRREGGGWEYVFDKKITRSATFGWHDGALVAEGETCPDEITVQTARNPLDPRAPRRLVLRAMVDDTGTGLATLDGLPLLRVSGEAGYDRVMVVPGATSGTARFFQGDGACVEEFALTGLERIFGVDAGEVILSVGGQEVFLPVVEPEED